MSSDEIIKKAWYRTSSFMVFIVFHMDSVGTIFPGQSPMLNQQDRISNLPAYVLENILLLLPTKDVVRTSVLSSKWRYVWTTISQLTFDKDIIGLLESEHRFTLKEYEYKLAKIVYQVLLFHKGPIHKFVLSTYLRSCSDVDSWIIILSKNGIRELILRFEWGDLRRETIYKLPSSLFFCETMIHLEICNCLWKLPPQFNGFGNLTTLSLDGVIGFSSNELNSLISKCQLLRKLILIEFDTGLCLRFNARLLEELYIDGTFEDLYLENTPVLANLIIYLADYPNTTEHLKFLRILGCQKCIKRLELRCILMPVLAKGYIPRRLSTPYNYLSSLWLECINFKDKQSVLMLRCFLESSPVLEDLVLEEDDAEYAFGPVECFWKGKKRWNAVFPRLRNLKLDTYWGGDTVIDILVYFLDTSPSLERITINIHRDLEELRLRILNNREDWLRKSSSTRAEIIVLYGTRWTVL